ncbi:Asp23/Gls24 family envelope stress response protein [Corynebacterium caspium]|uniref:Asp23/Gls24 family envelope stress response protein n=1 Tax=Corynebacterium caspium TaxID=234828 RepID=UPI00036C845D|nr:Asp23/Gls24 family envelope stress response protein [Corynebacterium caspium]WKD59848.1 Alkaline shock protein 23 [Corynebacterium caspium DSM 44850]
MANNSNNKTPETKNTTASTDTPTPKEVAENTAAEVAPTPAVDSPVVTDYGKTVIEDVVVGKIAGLAAREVTGVYALGGGAARMVGSLRSTLGVGENIQQGVNVEVGETQAAVDLSIIAEYGVAIHELAEAIRRNIIRAIERMTGLQVTEVNVHVTDVHVEQDEATDEEVEDVQQYEITANEVAEHTTPRVK